jgi:hypothetical protein
MSAFRMLLFLLFGHVPGDRECSESRLLAKLTIKPVTGSAVPFAGAPRSQLPARVTAANRCLNYIGTP